ncbi:hypothetical protein N656DRAFT_784802 [Canariomyces notabilis]|uniref:Uncharacterized protein n=1 Tax=Canariomyces notabilis TaxID=2074819 RepID=A0AAN6T855_9PEZI|nr:hypothetical protein N656DRAFT_784802 [Canariomyces arenarius]
MPTIEAPKQQEPMEAVSRQESGSGKIIAQQPKREPRPQLENDMSLRGGAMTLGCSCCHGTFSFHKRCC